MSLEFTTRDEIATARVEGHRVTFSLVPGYYATSTPQRLADKVSALGDLLGRELERSRVRTIERAYDAALDLDPLVAARARAAQSPVLSSATSPEGLVRVSCDRMSDWDVQVDPSVPRGVTEEAFTAAASYALSEILADQSETDLLRAAQQRTGASDANLKRARELMALLRTQSSAE